MDIHVLYDKTTFIQSRLCFHLQWILTLTVVVWLGHAKGQEARCEPIDIPLCQGLPYNMTRMPNLLQHSSQENARLSLEQFHPLVSSNCSSSLLFFLCAMYAPICTVNFALNPVPPCREECQRARAGCEPLIREHNASWPDFLDCDQLPTYDRGICVHPEAIVTSMPAVISEPFVPKTTKIEQPEVKTNKEGTSSQVQRPKQRCKCRKKTKLRRSVYRKGKFDFAIHARVLSQDRANKINMVTKISVARVLKSSRVPINTNSGIELWTNSTCVCPKLRRRKEYLILGHEDPATQRLLFLPDDVATIWRSKWLNKIKKWDRKKRRKNCRYRSNRKRRQCKRRKNKKPSRTSENETRTNSSKRRNRGKNRNSTTANYPLNAVK